MTTVKDFKNKLELCPVFQDSFSVVDFKITKNIGEGSFAKVFKAETILSNRKLPANVALKMMSQISLERKGYLEKVENEAKLLKNISNDNLIQFFGSFSDDDEIVLILEFVPRNLFRVLRKKVYFGETAIRFISGQVLLGLEYLHGNFIAHRDLKPENILLTKDWKVKLTDLSLSKVISSRSFTCQGTLEYMAPELIQNFGHGLPVDWWAFGILLFELCAGHTPFNDNYQLKMMKRIISAKIHFPMQFSEELKDLIKQLLKSDVSKRLGNHKGRANDIKQHSWYEEDINWDNLSNSGIPKELQDFKSKDINNNLDNFI